MVYWIFFAYSFLSDGKSVEEGEDMLAEITEQLEKHKVQFLDAVWQLWGVNYNIVLLL